MALDCISHDHEHVRHATWHVYISDVRVFFFFFFYKQVDGCEWLMTAWINFLGFLAEILGPIAVGILEFELSL